MPWSVRKSEDKVGEHCLAKLFIITSIDKPPSLSRLLKESICGVSFEHTQVEGSCKTSDSSYYPADATRREGATREGLVKEPYTCERLNSVPGGYQVLTDAVKALEFDFTNPQVS